MKKWRKFLLGMAAVGMSFSICGGGMITYADERKAMTEEEKEQKSEQMRQQMEEEKESYESWKSLSHYEQLGLMSEEAIQKNG